MDDDPAPPLAAAPAAAGNSSSSIPSSDEGTDTDTDASHSDPTPSHHQPLPDIPAPPPDPTPPPPAQPAEESRRLFQRLWTDEEELVILRGFLDFTSRRGTTFASHQYDTGPFYEEIRRKLAFDFSKNQLIEKLRRLKKKYRVCANRMASQGAAFAFKSAHESAIYDLARLIWRPGVKRDGDASDEDDINPAATVPVAALDDGGGGGVVLAPTSRGRGGRRVRRRTMQELEAPALPATPVPMLTDLATVPVVVATENSLPAVQPPSAAAPATAPPRAGGAIEEVVRSCLSPLLKELIDSVTVAGQVGLGPGLGLGGAGGDIIGLSAGVPGLNPGLPGNEKWRQQQILELEVYLKRIELVREQVTATLAELKSLED